MGWWNKRPQLGGWERSTRYSLIVSIEAPRVQTDLYTPSSQSDRCANRDRDLGFVKHIRGNRVHHLFVIVGLEEVAIAVHRHLEAAVAGESLHCSWA